MRTISIMLVAAVLAGCGKPLTIQQYKDKIKQCNDAGFVIAPTRSVITGYTTKVDCVDHNNILPTK